MDLNGKPPPDLSRFHENRLAFPPEERMKYAGKFVAWSPDGLRIIASGESEQEVEDKLVAMGVDPSQVVGENIPELGVSLL